MAKPLSWNKGTRPRFSIQCTSVRFLELSPSCFPKKKRVKELFPLSSRRKEREDCDFMTQKTLAIFQESLRCLPFQGVTIKDFGEKIHIRPHTLYNYISG